MYVNMRSKTLVVYSSIAMYTFLPGGWFAEVSDLLPQVEAGTLSRISDNWATNHPQYAEAVRYATFAPEDVIVE